jgi:hypothetical protein
MEETLVASQQTRWQARQTRMQSAAQQARMWQLLAELRDEAVAA